jgi:hypothetical protein
MKTKLKIAWGQWPKGHVFDDMPGGQARTLIARGVAEEISGETTKAMASPVDRMMRSKRDLKIKAH